MEWTGSQQMIMLVRCGGLGFLLGILFDLFSITGQSHRRSRTAVFLSDALFGVAAAPVTFFAALAIMEGRMHPLLFAGSAVGFAVQHVTLGRFGSRMLYRVGTAIISALRWGGRTVTAPFRRLYYAAGRGAKSLAALKKAPKCRKNRKNLKKNQKNSCN